MAKKKINRYCVTTTHGTFYCEGIKAACFKDNDADSGFLAIVKKFNKDNTVKADMIFNIQHVICWKDISDEKMPVSEEE